MTKAAGVDAAVALTGAAYLGSTAPDWLEVRIGSRTLIPHRTVTHWLLPWLALIAAGIAALPTSPLAGASLTGFALGGLSHWLGDFGTPMGVPILHPTRRSTLGLWGTGKGEFKPILAAWLAAALSLELAYPGFITGFLKGG